MQLVLCRTQLVVGLTWTKSTVSRCITRVTAAILEVYKGGFEFNGKSTRDTFLERFGLPSITGAIDCTHIEIPAPPSELHPDEYINRKNYYSINVQSLSQISTCARTGVWSNKKAILLSGMHVKSQVR